MKDGGKLLAMVLAAMLVSTPIKAAENTSRADKLKELGLFRGTENGYDLDSTFTREQGVTMIVRLTGAEEAALNTEYRRVFHDVPKDRWSFGYVMYCYENKITMGTGNDAFTPENSMTAEQYISFIMRLLGYTDTAPENAYDYAVKKGLINTATVQRLKGQEAFLRDDMVYISYNALKTKIKGGNILAYALANKGVISMAQAESFDINKAAEDINEMVDMFLD